MFEGLDFDTLMERMLSNCSDKYDKREGSVIYDALAPAALELANFYVVLDMVMDEVFADTESYYYLIKRAAEKGIFPYEETPAVGKMAVSPTHVSVAVGDRFSLRDLNYAVVSVIDAEAGEYQIECETPGIIGNQQMGDLLPIETQDELNDLESAKLTEILIPGEEEEDVEQFRDRYFRAVRQEAFGGNQADYREKVNAVDGVGDCKIKRAWEQGYDPASMMPGEAVRTWFEGQSDETVSSEVYSWLSRVFCAADQKLLVVGGTVRITVIDSEFSAPSQMLVSRVQEIIDPAWAAGEGTGIAPIGHVVDVVGVSGIPINVQLVIEYDSGYTFEDIGDSIKGCIDSYFLELRRAWAGTDSLIVRISRIESEIIRLPGVVDLSDTLLNGRHENLVLNEDEIPVRGDVIG